MNRETNMPEVKDTSLILMSEAIEEANKQKDKFINMTEAEILQEALRLTSEKELLKATIKFQKQKIIKLQSNG